MTYTWDEEKNRSNIRKHGIDFLDVPAMFQHPMVTFLDQRQDYGEDRWVRHRNPEDPAGRCGIHRAETGHRQNNIGQKGNTK